MALRSRIVLSLLAAVVCSGCVTAEGVSLGTQSYINEGFVKYGNLPDESAKVDADDSGARVTGLIAVGNVSAYRDISHRKAESEYRKYVKAFESWESNRQPDMSLEQFTRTVKGWTNIKAFGVPLLFAGYLKALVPAEAAENVRFEPAFGTFLLQSSGDLVAAKTNSDGALVVEALLCSDLEPGYSKCAKSYEKGLFDAKTGQKLKGKLQITEGGTRIDPRTFRLVESAPRQSDATHPVAGDET